MDNVAAIIDFHADRRPDAVAVIDGDRTLTYAGFLARIEALASALRELGTGPGDVVAILLTNRAEFLEAVYAVNRLGAAFLPLNYRLAPAEWTYILGHGGACVLVSEPEFAPAVDGLADELPALRTRVLVAGAPRPGWSAYEELLGAHAGEHVDPVDVGPDDLQRLMYTSGTTSRPKGVCLSHRNTTAKNLGLIVHFGWTAEQVTAVAGPLHHVGALDMGGVTTLHAGGRLVLQRRFDAAGLIDLIAHHRVTTVWLAPAMVSALLQCESELARADLGSVGLILSGGEKMPESRLARVLDLFPGLWFADAYGLTETTSSDTFMPRDAMRAKLGSVGKPIPLHRVRVVDDDGVDAGAGRLGEIVVRGPKVFSGYWRDPDATAASFRDGWFRTGDVGRLDAEGFLYVEDRRKDMIVSGGENIATPEIERVLYEHPAVLEAAVVGHPDERWGEVPHAFVVLRDGLSLHETDLAGHCRDRLARFKVPKYFDVVQALPRTPSGKVLKRDLRLDLDRPRAGAR